MDIYFSLAVTLAEIAISKMTGVAKVLMNPPTSATF